MPDPPKKIIKSRSGCRACKQKRMKCDEADLPGCKNCLKRGIECPGYVRPLKWSTKHERFESTTRSVRSPQAVPKSTLGPPLKTSQAGNKVPQANPERCQNGGSVLDLRLGGPIIAKSPAISPTLSARDEQTESSVDDEVHGHFINPSHSYTGSAKDPYGNSHGLGSVMSYGNNQSEINHLGWTPRHHYSGWNVERPLPMPCFSQDDAHAEKLMSHYFGAICRVMSCFDSPTNPYRTDIPQALHLSQHMFHCMMSMAASHLTNYEGEMAVTTLNYQTKAVKILQEEMTRLALVAKGAPASPGTRYQVLLGTIILGMTSAWHDPSAYTLTHLQGARLLFRTWAKEQQLLDSAGNVRILTREENFIVGSMAYWESLASFLIDQSLDSLDYLLPYCNTAEGQRIYPHSWTGISLPIFVYLAQVGILLRQKRIIAKLSHIGRSCPQSVSADSGLLIDAQEIYSRLLTYTLPPLEHVEETGDAKTPVSHLCDLAKIYRYVMLLELYQAFPALGNNKVDVEGKEPFQCSQKGSQQLIFDLATSALTVISNLPRSSGIITVLAIAYISAGSALQNTQHTDKPANRPSLDDELNGIRHSPSTVLTWRENVRQHVMHAVRELGLASIQRCAKLVQQVWTRSDIQIEMGAKFETVLPIHWMDVMIEERLETLYG